MRRLSLFKVAKESLRGLTVAEGADKGLWPLQSIDKRVGEFSLFNFHIRDRNDSPLGAFLAESFRKPIPDRTAEGSNRPTEHRNPFA